jgi:hypothetical protein
MLRPGHWLALCCLVLLGACGGNGLPDLDVQPQLYRGQLEHPADVLYFQGHYVATDLYSNRLVVSADLSFEQVSYLEPPAGQLDLRSPHYLARSPQGTLLVTNGWGGSVVEVADLDGSRWREFRGDGRGFKAPHGICASDDGWIYVGDSLNSRIVRFRDMDGSGWQVFADHERKVAYARQLHCAGHELWVSNSYERRAGLNPGRGSSVLRISDFDSGRAQEVLRIGDSNMTALLPLADGRTLIGLWGAYRSLGLVEPSGVGMRLLPRSDLGVPYSLYRDPVGGGLLVVHTGAVADRNRDQLGGILVYPPRS